MTIQSLLLDLAIGPIYGVKPPTPTTMQSFIAHREQARAQGQGASLYAGYDYVRNFVASRTTCVELGRNPITSTMATTDKSNMTEGTDRPVENAVTCLPRRVASINWLDRSGGLVFESRRRAAAACQVLRIGRLMVAMSSGELQAINRSSGVKFLGCPSKYPYHYITATAS
ncbi:hypothetical protein V8B97DRAFT_2108365 [Scleroderma yunnanense]